jgi:hypothetical protein
MHEYACNAPSRKAAAASGVLIEHVGVHDEGGGLWARGPILFERARAQLNTVCVTR